MDPFRNQKALKPYFETAYGWAVFDSIVKGGIGLGGAVGKGKVYVRGEDGTEQLVGQSNMLQVSYGFQLGGQMYSEIIFFETEHDFQNFTQGNFEFGADANVTALTASANAKASSMGNQGGQVGVSAEKTELKSEAECRYVKGLKVATITQGGLMYEASISGQKFNFHPVTAAS
jgi:lipid-binding SYLF domain-containing protein